jgi:SAM-dependent methyltransferase
VSEDPRAIADHMDARCCGRVDAGEDLTRPKGVSRDLVATLDEVGVRGRSVLDVGCGAGGLCLTLLEHGASSAVGVDLSPQAVEQATRASRARGVEDRASFRVADGSRAALEPADVVVLDKVYCCFHDPVALRANTLPAARMTYAIVLPPSGGVRGVLARVAVRLENLLRWFQRDDFRAHVHDVAALDTAIREAGFRPAVVRRRRPVWDLRIYTRAPAPDRV